jgi:integrase
MMLKSAFTFSDKVAECYIQMTVIRLAKIGVKEIGDQLGHRNLETTRIYTKVDLTHLREVADIKLGGLLCD